MKIALFPGTFDPPTLGHLNIIKRASSICDKLYVAVGVNSDKKELFTLQERKAMLAKICKPHPYAEVISFSGLAVTCAQQIQAHFMIRGLRAFSDFAFEATLALANRKLSGIETCFLVADETTPISSTLIREIGKLNGNLEGFVPPEIEKEILLKLSRASINGC